jgi:hypothetical protein
MASSGRQLRYLALCTRCRKVRRYFLEGTHPCDFLDVMDRIVAESDYRERLLLAEAV